MHTNDLDLITQSVDPKMMTVEVNKRQDEANPYKTGVLELNYRSTKYLQKQLSRKSRKRLLADIDDFPMCQEVTFEVFEARFIKRYHRFMSKQALRKMSAIFIWTEIMSVIKGSIAGRFSAVTGWLTADEYQTEGSAFLTKREKSTLYYLFLKYEEWKLNVKAFDFLDVVNHVVKESVTKGSSQHEKMDYLIIDEVQDLYPKTAKLLLD